MAKFLHALSLQFYRGIGPEEQRISGFQDFNFFIGANNAGKSIVLNFLTYRLKQGRKGVEVNSVESYRGRTTGAITYSIGIPNEKFLAAAINQLPQGSRDPFTRDMVEKIVTRVSRTEYVWVAPTEGRNDHLEYVDANNVLDLFNERGWRSIWGVLTQQSGGSLERDLNRAGFAGG